MRSLQGRGLRASSESVDDFTDSQLRTVTDSLCEAFAEPEAESGTAMDEAWAEAGVEEVELDEIIASLELVEAACPEVLNADLVADNEPIPVSMTLVGSEGDEYTYSVLSGCQGEGGYSDIRDGMLFNITDERGDVLGVARLDNSEETSLGCEVSGSFAVTFGELDDDTLYIVGDRAGQRGELAYTGAELKQQGGVELSLG